MRVTILTILLSVVILSGSGCGHKLKPDPVWPPAIQANYPTAEVHACGQVPDALGLATCSVLKGTDLHAVGLQVMAYHQGTIKVAASECGLDEEITYTGTKLVSIPMTGVADRNCLVTVTVLPKFPKEAKSGVRVYPLQGHLAIRVLEAGDAWEGTTRKVTGDFTSHIRLWVGDQSNVRLFIAGCSEPNYDKIHPVTGGFAELDLADVLQDKIHFKTCVLEGIVISDHFKNFLFNILVSSYDPRFTPLPTPAVSYKDGKLKVVADAAVTAISLNGTYTLASQVEFKKYNPAVVNYLRLLTVNGRAVLGTWNPVKKVWSWKN